MCGDGGGRENLLIIPTWDPTRFLMLANFLSSLGAAQTNHSSALDIPFQVNQWDGV